VNILLVDDDAELCALLSEFLQREGFIVECAHEGHLGLEMAARPGVDLVVLDVMLPGIDGFEILKRLRQQSKVPVMMLTARGEDVDRIVGLELGADDYIAKPFNPREVVARVKNIVNRVERKPVVTRVAHDVQRVSDLEIDRTGHEVRVKGAPVKLTPMEYRILDVLLRNAGAALTRAQLLDNVNADSTDVFDRTLDKHIANLRHKIGDDPNRPRYILTVHGVGYKFAQ
jgi:two-component system response regulator CpxR